MSTEFMYVRTQLVSPPTKEYFIVDYNRYLPNGIPKKEPSKVEDQEEEEDISHAVIPSQ